MVQFKTEETVVAVAADTKTLMSVFRLTPMEARFLQAMLKHNSWVGKEELPELSWSIRQVIYNLRTKLDRKHIKVINDGQGRYTITPDSKEVVKREILSSVYSGE